LVFRLVSSLTPLAALWITKLIIDRIAHALSSHEPMPRLFWWLVGAEFAIAIVGSILGRTIDYLDALLGGQVHAPHQYSVHAARGGTGSHGI